MNIKLHLGNIEIFFKVLSITNFYLIEMSIRCIEKRILIKIVNEIIGRILLYAHMKGESQINSVSFTGGY